MRSCGQRCLVSFNCNLLIWCRIMTTGEHVVRTNCNVSIFANYYRRYRCILGPCSSLNQAIKSVITLTLVFLDRSLISLSARTQHESPFIVHTKKLLLLNIKAVLSFGILKLLKIFSLLTFALNRNSIGIFGINCWCLLEVKWKICETV